MGALRRRLSYANVVSTLCLFILLGGTSYAVATGSIDSRELKNNSVRSTDLRNNTVRSRDVRNGTLTSDDISPATLAALRGAGPQGPAGVKGAQGAPGISGLQRVIALSATNSDSSKNVAAYCPAGKQAIGSGADITGADSGLFPDILTDVVIDQIIPSQENSIPGFVSVSAFEEDATAANWAVFAYAICAYVS